MTKHFGGDFDDAVFLNMATLTGRTWRVTKDRLKPGQVVVLVADSQNLPPVHDPVPDFHALIKMGETEFRLDQLDYTSGFEAIKRSAIDAMFEQYDPCVAEKDRYKQALHAIVNHARRALDGFSEEGEIALRALDLP